MLVVNYKRKKDLKESLGMPLRFQDTSIHSPEYKETGKMCVVGPGAYDRKWYAQVWTEDGLIVKVK